MATCSSCKQHYDIPTCTDTLILGVDKSGGITTYDGYIENLSTERIDKITVTTPGNALTFDTSNYTFQEENYYKIWVVDSTDTSYEPVTFTAADNTDETCGEFGVIKIEGDTGLTVDLRVK